MEAIKTRDGHEIAPGKNLMLVCKTNMAGTGLSIPVHVIKVLPREKNVRKNKQEVVVLLQTMEELTVMVGDLWGGV